NAVGDAVIGNTSHGIEIVSTNNTIGGTTAAARNVISGNGQNEQSGGILITGAFASGNLVEGNYIGTNAAGTAALGNGGNGVYVAHHPPDTTIGGSTAAAGNVISGNRAYGVEVDTAVRTTIQNNLIGVKADGTTPLLNTSGSLDIAEGASVLAAGSFTGNVV